MVCAAASSAWSACKPNHFRPAFFVKTMGACAFDPQTLSYSGDPVAQAKCLMRGMDATRNLAPAMESLPPALASRVGQDSGLPSREALSAFLSKENLEWEFAAYLWQPVSRAHDNDADAPPARYFVIHDTSGPNYGHRSFPADIDVSAKLNNLGQIQVLGWLGQGSRGRQSLRRDVARSRFCHSLARDAVRASGKFRRRPEGALPPRRADPAAAQRSRARMAQRRAEPKSGLCRRAI